MAFKILFFQRQQGCPGASLQRGSTFYLPLPLLHDPALLKGGRSEPGITGPP